MDIRWDACPCQHFGLHGVEAFALTDTQLDLHSVVGVVLEEEAVVDDKLCVGSRAIEDVDLQEEETISIHTIIITKFTQHNFTIIRSLNYSHYTTCCLIE